MTRTFRSSTALAAALALLTPAASLAETVLDPAAAAALDSAARADQPDRAADLDAELAAGLTPEALACAVPGVERPCPDDMALATPAGVAVYLAEGGDILLAPRTVQEALAKGDEAVLTQLPEEVRQADAMGEADAMAAAQAATGADAAAADAPAPEVLAADAPAADAPAPEALAADAPVADAPVSDASADAPVVMAQAAPEPSPTVTADAPVPTPPEAAADAPAPTDAPQAESAPAPVVVSPSADAAAPSADAPAADAPAPTDAPMADAPVVADAPAVEPPVADAPAADAPVVAEAPAADAPVADAPATGAPVVADAPKADAPVVVVTPTPEAPASQARAAQDAPVVVPGSDPDTAALAEALAAATGAPAPAAPATDAGAAPIAASGQTEAPRPVVVDETQTKALEAALAQAQAATAAPAPSTAQDAPAPAPTRTPTPASGAPVVVVGDSAANLAAGGVAPTAEALNAPAVISDNATAVVVTEGSARSSWEDFSTRVSDKLVREQQAEFQRLAEEAAARAAAGQAAVPGSADAPPPPGGTGGSPVVVTPGTGSDGAPVVVPPSAGNDDSDADRMGQAILAGIGGFVLAQVLAQNGQVALNTGDRVVVQMPDGSQQIIKDDNALLLQPGAQVTTENFPDGSSRAIVTREDGSRVVTIRDAQLRVLRRTLIAGDGTVTELINETAPVDPVVVANLPPAAAPVVIEGPVSEAALRDALAREAATSRRFTLGQIRNIAEVRALVAPVDISAITFDTGSAAIKPDQAQQLATLGKVISDYVRANPAEVFLIEGHTDSVGSEVTNLALSDRRAESVALALTEYFRVPPENLVVQGYGERFLKVAAEGDIRANRRASVRRITDLLATR